MHSLMVAEFLRVFRFRRKVEAFRRELELFRKTQNEDFKCLITDKVFHIQYRIAICVKTYKTLDKNEHVFYNE